MYIINETKLDVIHTGHLLASEELFFVANLTLANS